MDKQLVLYDWSVVWSGCTLRGKRNLCTSTFCNGKTGQGGQEPGLAKAWLGEFAALQLKMMSSQEELYRAATEFAALHARKQEELYREPTVDAFCQQSKPMYSALAIFRQLNVVAQVFERNPGYAFC